MALGFLHDPNDPKVRDHCHYTGCYRGAAHLLCNLRYRVPSYIPVVFHNLLGYDVHMFIKELGKHSNDTMRVIAKNTEDYISFSIDVAVDKYIGKNGVEKDKFIELTFIDSFKFMSSSLDSLVSNLVRGSTKLFGFDDYNESHYDLLTRKGIYPCEYMSSCDGFKETQLPPIEAFYSNLNMSNMTSDDYQHAQRAWKEFGICNIGERYMPRALFSRSSAFLYSPGLVWKACLRNCSSAESEEV